MLAVAQGGTTEIAVVALPCAWIYGVVGKHFLKNGPPACQTSYRDWLMLLPRALTPEFQACPGMDAGPVDTWGAHGGPRQEETHGAGVSDQLEVRVDVLGDGLERGEVAGVGAREEPSSCAH